jgi:tetratricopeptide (TPR) repeat protein
MNLHASKAEIDTLECVLRRAAPGEGVVATKVALAWHLRQRDSARTLQLVQEVMPVVRAARSTTHGDAIASCHARAALAAAEASALYDEMLEAERCLLDARAHLNTTWDPQAEGDIWMVESMVARSRGQADRSIAALRQASRCFERVGEHERLEVARAWIFFEAMLQDPQGKGGEQALPAPPVALKPCTARDAIRGAARAIALSSRNPAVATRAFSEAGELAQERGLVLLEFNCMLEVGAASHELGDYDRAARCFDAAASRARDAGWPTQIVTCDMHFGALLCDLGALDESRRMLEGAIDALSPRARGPLLANAHAALARTLLATKRTSDSLAQMEAAMALLRAAGSPRDLALNLILHARVLGAAAQPARAVDVLAEAQALVDARGFDSMRMRLCQAHADLHHRFTLPPPPHMTLPTGALHFAEAALVHGRRLTGWNARATLHDFLAERWAEAGDHRRAYACARHALAAKERETTQKMSYPLALLRVRRHAEVSAAPQQASEAAARRPPRNLDDRPGFAAR